MGVLVVILNKVGVSLGWMYLAMGLLIGSTVLPIAFMLLWRKANAIDAILGTTVGCVLGIMTWLVVTSLEYGRVNLDTTGRSTLMLAGNLVSILSGGFIHAVCSFLQAQNYDRETTQQITMIERVKSELAAEEFKEEKLQRAKAWIVKWGLAFTVVIVIVWPLLSLPAETMWPMNMRGGESMESGPYPQRPGEPDYAYYIRTGLCRFGMTCRYPPSESEAGTYIFVPYY